MSSSSFSSPLLLIWLDERYRYAPNKILKENWIIYLFFLSQKIVKFSHHAILVLFTDFWAYSYCSSFLFFLLFSFFFFLSYFLISLFHLSLFQSFLLFSCFPFSFFLESFCPFVLAVVLCHFFHTFFFPFELCLPSLIPSYFSLSSNLWIFCHPFLSD